MLSDKPLPSDVALETAIIAGVIGCASQQAARRVAATIRPEAFAGENTRAAWQVVRDLGSAGTVDLTNFLQRASGAGVDPLPIIRLPGMSPAALDVSVGTLCDLAHRRALMLAGAATWEQAGDGRQPAGEVSRSLDVARREAIATFGGDSSLTMSEAGAQFDAMCKVLTSDLSGCLYTGIPEIDAHGPIPAEYCLIAARSSIGKTAYALSTILQQVRAGKRVAFWSGEQQVSMIVCKLVSLLTGLGSDMVMGVVPTATYTEAENIKTARALIESLPIAMLDGRKSVEQLWGWACQLKAQGPLHAVYLDQFDKITLPGRDRQNREERLSEVSRNLFAMMQDLGVPVFLLAQLNIKAQSTHPAPAAWHVRDCGQVVQDVDRAYILDRPTAEPERWAQMCKDAARLASKGNREMQERLQRLDGGAICRLEKNRNGVGGTWAEVIPFDATCGRFGRAPR